MTAKKFLTLITATGAEYLARAAITGVPLAIAEMAVGDGGGQLLAPSAMSPQLIDEKYRGTLNRVVIADSDASIIEAEMIMPPQIGGFWLRELALYAEDGACLAVGNMPETYKPLLAEGSGRFQVIRMQLKVSCTADVELTANPSVILATAEEVTKAKNEAKDYADTLAGELERLVREAVTQATRDAWEEDNPPGTTRFFNQELNPNERWPWSEWVYTGENKTIRIGKADGSNVGATGGSDTVTLQQANLPAVQIDVSGETSEQAEQKIRTSEDGEHNHGGVAGKDDPWEIGGDVRQLFNPKEWGVTDMGGKHDHEVIVPPHKHTTSGKTASLGESKSFSVVEAHTLLMCWSRVA